MENEEEKGMKPIWYFVGLILGLMGFVITLSGIYYVMYPGQSHTELHYLHPDLWWGIIMMISGLIFWWKTKDLTVK